MKGKNKSSTSVRNVGGFDTDNGSNAKRQNSNTPIKVAGEKGAESHTVPEGSRIQFTEMLLSLRDSSDKECKLEFTSELTNTERKFLHELSIKLGLVSKSSGKGDDRRITVRKVAERKRIVMGIDGEEEGFPELRIGTKGIHKLNEYVKAYPPDEKESYETGSSLLHSLTKQRREFTTSISNNDDNNNNIQQSDFDLVQILQSFEVTPSPYIKHEHKHPHSRTVEHKQRKQWHINAQQARYRHPKYAAMKMQRQRLPSFTYATQICEAIRSNSVVIISGDTGCGKTTQVPQFILDDPEMGPTCNMIITQPRRISAMSVAERVASERCENLGQCVGYNVRLDSCCSTRTQCLFVTPGVLLRKLQSNPTLDGYTHIILDEVHERDRYSEFLIICLKDILSNKRTSLKVVLMSATLQTQELVDYWRGVGISDNDEHYHPGQYYTAPPEVNIPGRTFPVQVFFLEDILGMTGFVDEDYRNNYMAQLDKDLSKLMQNKLAKHNGRTTPQSTAVSPPKLSSMTLTCCMCNKSGFRCPEELGTHVATCVGDPALSMIELEFKLRSVDGISSVTEDKASEYNFVAQGSAYEKENVEQAVQEGPKEKYDDDDGNLIPNLWHGEGNFSDFGSVQRTTTLTEEEMLMRYHTSHDDENIDEELVLTICHYIIQSSYGDGAILIFFPGWIEISEFLILLESTAPFNDAKKFWILPLHSGIAAKDQRMVFKNPPRGVRKIILATNIAETSVTIDDVAFVVDTGRAKEKSYDPHLKTATLQPVWISQASVTQRKGRAGRTRPGVCFHLFSRRRYSSFRPFRESELLRTPLEEMCLQCKKLHLAPGGFDEPDGISAFLAKALTPPHPKSIANALELLVEIGAMEEGTNNLTDLGKCLSVLSLEPRVGKMVIWAHLLGCSKVGIEMGVAMSYKSPFVLPPPHLRKTAELAMVDLSKNSESDQITVLNVLHSRDHFMAQKTVGEFYSFCSKKFISSTVLNTIADLRKNVSRELISLGFPPDQAKGFHNRHDQHQDKTAFLQAAIVAGLYPNLAYRRTGEMNFSTMTNKKAKIHISSVNSFKRQRLQGKCASPKGEVQFVVFGEMVKGASSFHMSQTTYLTSPLPLILLCGKLCTKPCDHLNNSKLIIDNWLIFQCSTDIATSLVILRKRLDTIFLSFLRNPNVKLSSLKSEDRDALETLSEILKSSYQSCKIYSNNLCKGLDPDETLVVALNMFINKEVHV